MLVSCSGSTSSNTRRASNTSRGNSNTNTAANNTNTASNNANTATSDTSPATANDDSSTTPANGDVILRVNDTIVGRDSNGKPVVLQDPNGDTTNTETTVGVFSNR
ncbi:MAG: hypothetical protein AAFX80_14665, partial [Cyanobacteria bacterium J06639_18]